jgi:acetyl-CoA synthetase
MPVPWLLITSDGQNRGGKALPLKSIADEALESGCPSIKNVIVVKRTGAETAMTAGRDFWADDLVAQQSDVCEPEWVEAEHPLFLLYTSGSTGKPKGVQHSTGGYLLHAILTMKYTFDIKPDDVFWCTADIGWVTGHTYITYGPLACGATEIVFEGVPTYPDAGRFWKMIQDHKVSIFYTAPTAIRSLIKAADNTPAVHPKKYDCPACASWVPSASRSTRLPGSGTTRTLAAAAARSSIPSGRPRPVAT